MVIMRRLFALLVLAMIALQALPSSAATFQPRYGSAFSASTLDVALAPPGRSDVVSTVENLPLPPVPMMARIVTGFPRWLADDAIDLHPVSVVRLRDGAGKLNRAPRPPPAS